LFGAAIFDIFWIEETYRLGVRSKKQWQPKSHEPIWWFFRFI